jgi:assimilatory nitrate reductase catalytic subunit
MPPAVAHLAGARDHGGLVVVDPRASATAALTDDGAGMHLQPVPGSDLALLLGLLHVVVAEGLTDVGYVQQRTSGWDTVLTSIAPWWPERVEQVTGVPAESVRRAAYVLANASPARGGRGAYVLTGRGVEQSTQGTATVTAAINLALALGLPGRVGSGYGAITGQGNGQGGREHGQKADQLPGYRMIDDPRARAHVAAVWGVPADSLPGKGKPAVELLASLGTPAGREPCSSTARTFASAPPTPQRVAARLEALDLLVVCDVVPSETAAAADVVLPVLQWAEEEGTMTSLEGRIIRRRAAISPPPGPRSELWVWLAARRSTRGAEHLVHRCQRGLRRAGPSQRRRARRLQRREPRPPRHGRGDPLALSGPRGRPAPGHAPRLSRHLSHAGWTGPIPRRRACRRHA